MLVLMYAFIGFEFSLINAGETRNAKAAIPKMLVTTVASVAIFYTLIQLIAVSVGPDLGDSDAPLVELAERLMGPWGAVALGLGVVFSVGGGSLTSFVTAPRLTFALARDGSLPAWFGRVSERTGAPVNSIIFCGLLCFALAISQGFVWLVTLSTFIRLVVYLLCIGSLPRIEKSLPEEQDQFKLPGGLAIPVLGFLLTVWLISHSTFENFSIAAVIVLIGTGVFWVSTRRNAGAEITP